MAELRSAVDAEITEEDTKAIVRAFVDKAKNGDERAAKFVLEYLMGGKFTPQSVEIHNHYGEPRPIEVEPRELSARERIYAYLQASGPTKAAVIAADLDMPLKTVTGTLNHSWFKRNGQTAEIAIQEARASG